MKPDLPELSPQSRALFEAGRSTEAVPPEVADRLWRQLATALPPLPLPSPHPLHLARTAATRVAKSYTLKQLALVGAGIFGAGIGAGVGVTVAVTHARPSAPVTQPAPVAAVPTLSVLPPPPIVAPAVAPAPAPSPRPKVVHPAAPRPPPKVEAPVVAEPPSDADLAAERSLIAEARSALQHGVPADALAALRAHEGRFPTGRLGEEREALRVQALVASGDRAAAEAAAAQFARKYPQSLMGPAVQAALHRQP